MNQLSLDLQPVPEYRTIPLSKGQVAIVDAADYEWLTQWKWKALWNATIQNYYACRTQKRAGKSSCLYMHRLIMNAPAGVEVDHRDRHTLDNRRSNMRLATRAQNAWNQPKRRNNTSGFKGVYWHAPAKKWYAQIMLHGVSRHLGFYDDPAEAGAAYVTASAKMRGEFCG